MRSLHRHTDDHQDTSIIGRPISTDNLHCKHAAYVSCTRVCTYAKAGQDLIRVHRARQAVDGPGAHSFMF